MSRTFKQRIVTGLISMVVKSLSLGTMTFGTNEELITLSTSGLTTDTSATFLPANSLILTVTGTVTTTITTASGWKMGTSSVTGRFTANNTTLTAGTTDVGLVHWQADTTAANAGPSQPSAGAMRITAATSNPGAGVVRATCFYLKFAAPTS